MRLAIGLPLVLSLAAFVLSMLALFAGNKPGFMEDYHILMLNTSMLGHNLVPTPSSGNAPTTTSGGSGVGGFFSAIRNSATAAVGAVESKIASLEGELADKLADSLGIQEFYSLHVQDLCEGSFTPNATSPGAGYNVTNCTEPLQTGKYNISAKLDHELSVGPVHLNLADLGFTKELQDQFDKIPGLMLALAVFYILGAGFAGISMLSSAASLFYYSKHPRRTVLLNGAIASLSVLTLLIANLITTVGGKKATDEINKLGSDIGLSAVTGTKFIAITWTAFGLMLITAVYWVYDMFSANKARRSGRHPKHLDRPSMEEYSSR